MKRYGATNRVLYRNVAFNNVEADLTYYRKGHLGLDISYDLMKLYSKCPSEAMGSRTDVTQKAN